MKSIDWAVVRKRAALSLPLVQALCVYYGIGTGEEVALWVALASGVITGTALGINPRVNTVNVSRETWDHVTDAYTTPNVSRETLDPNESVANYIERTTGGITVYPCSLVHGSAEPHVLGCEGWREGTE